MKVGVYNESAGGSSDHSEGGSIGGSEVMAAVLSEALAQHYEVDLLHHRSSLSRERLANVSSTNLNQVRLRYIKSDSNPTQHSRNLWRRYQSARKWKSALSEPYDVFVALMHTIPPFCHASTGVLIVLFPFYLPLHIQSSNVSLRKLPLRQRIGRSYQKWEWMRRMESYQLKTAISDFSQIWTQRRWEIDCEILHPPVDTQFRRVEKENIILSVGRFAIENEGHGKKQLEMMTTFREMESDGLNGWHYLSVGGLGGSPEHRLYFDKVSNLAMDCQGKVVANMERPELMNLYERAGIFWHAAGYGEDETTHPELTEHFGISTVEAMAAGCVPVVINKGGQQEIVQHGVNGFLWDTLEQLKEYTNLLVRDEQLRARMSDAARERARFFSREKETEKFFSLLRPLVEKKTHSSSESP